MKSIVIYKSKTGFTKKYAQWIAEDLSADILDVSKVTMSILTSYDTIIYGGSLYAGGIIGVKLIKENINKLKDKKVLVFATGASPAREDVINEVRNKNFTQEEQKYIKFFYLKKLPQKKRYYKNVISSKHKVFFYPENVDIVGLFRNLTLFLE